MDTPFSPLLSPRPRPLHRATEPAPVAPVLLTQPFEDRRSRTEKNRFPPIATPGQPWREAGCGSGQTDALLIAGLLVTALHESGLVAELDVPPGLSVSVNHRSVHRVLTGQLWSFALDEEAGVPILVADLHMELRDPRSSALLWSANFPGDVEVPLWVGLGCRPELAVPAALAAFRIAAGQCFASDTFRQAAGNHGVSREVVRDEPLSTHEIVGSASWTAAETGEIEFAATESPSLLSDEPIPTAAIYAAAGSTVGSE